MLYIKRFALGGLMLLLLLLGGSWMLAPSLWQPVTSGAPLGSAPRLPTIITATPTVTPFSPAWQGGALPAGALTPVPSPEAVPTSVAQNTSTQTTTTTTDDSSGTPSCAKWWGDICAGMYDFFVNDIVRPTINAFTTTLDQVKDILWTTPANSTYTNQNITPFWDTSLWLVTIALAGVIAWTALRHMLGMTFSNWLSYSDLLELFPRLAFGLFAAFLSLRFCGWIIDISNALCTMFSTEMLTNMTKGSSENLVTILFQVIYIIMGFLLLLEEGARYAILYILISFAPLWMFAASLRETAPIAKGGTKAFVLFTFLQPAQIAVMDLGGNVIAAIVKDPTQLTILNILVGLGIMLIVLLMFFIVAQQAMGGLGMPLAAAATGLTGLMAGKTARGIGRGSKAIAGPPLKLAGKGVGGAGKFVGRGIKKGLASAGEFVKDELRHGGGGLPGEHLGPDEPWIGPATIRNANRAVAAASSARAASALTTRTPRSRQYTGNAAQSIRQSSQQQGRKASTSGTGSPSTSRTRPANPTGTRAAGNTSGGPMIRPTLPPLPKRTPPSSGSQLPPRPRPRVTRHLDTNGK